jgi:uncharacterized Zn finger protein (UPF0148 family)
MTNRCEHMYDRDQGYCPICDAEKIQEERDEAHSSTVAELEERIEALEAELKKPRKVYVYAYTEDPEMQPRQVIKSFSTPEKAFASFHRENPILLEDDVRAYRETFEELRVTSIGGKGWIFETELDAEDYVIEFRNGGFLQNLDDVISGPKETAQGFTSSYAANKFLNEHEWVQMNGGMVVARQREME